MSSVLSPPPLFSRLRIRFVPAGSENHWVPQQVLAFSVIHILLKATAGFIFTLTRIGNCAAGRGSHFPSVDWASGLLALLSPHSSPAYCPLWLVELADSAQVVLTHLLAPLRPLQSLSARHSAKAKPGFFSRTATLTSHFLTCRLLWSTSAPLKRKEISVLRVMCRATRWCSGQHGPLFARRFVHSRR